MCAEQKLLFSVCISYDVFYFLFALHWFCWLFGDHCGRRIEMCMFRIIERERKSGGMKETLLCSSVHQVNEFMWSRTALYYVQINLDFFFVDSIRVYFSFVLYAWDCMWSLLNIFLFCFIFFLLSIAIHLCSIRFVSWFHFRISSHHSQKAKHQRQTHEWTTNQTTNLILALSFVFDASG